MKKVMKEKMPMKPMHPMKEMEKLMKEMGGHMKQMQKKHKG